MFPNPFFPGVYFPGSYFAGASSAPPPSPDRTNLQLTDECTRRALQNVVDNVLTGYTVKLFKNFVHFTSRTTLGELIECTYVDYAPWPIVWGPFYSDPYYPAKLAAVEMSFATTDPAGSGDIYGWYVDDGTDLLFGGNVDSFPEPVQLVGALELHILPIIAMADEF